MIMPGSSNQAFQPYKYNGKEFVHQDGLNLYDYGARRYDAARTQFTTIDPMAEKYPWISPYAYCLNNPVNLVDPTGMDIRIYYQDNNGKTQNWIFNGKNAADAPQNRFVQDFILSYNYNVGNGGGESLKEAATNSKYMIGLREGTNKDGDDETSYLDLGKTNDVVWFPGVAVKAPGGWAMSPATVLDHEFGHAVDYFNDPEEFNMRQNGWKDKLESLQGTPKYWDVYRKYHSAEYGNRNEERVITGTEARTAQANGEYPPNYVRPDHFYVGRIKVSSPISNGQKRVIWKIIK
jgi:RHS repeat-associated protein